MKTCVADLLIGHDAIGSSSIAEDADRQAGSEMAISVCIPAFNEERSIEEAVCEAAEVLSQIDGYHEILVVDDGSTDRTWQILMDLHRRLPNLRTIRHDQNLGLAAAFRELVRQSKGEFIFQVAADRQWKMAELIPMLTRLRDGYDIVIGLRRRKHYTLWRRVVSRCFNNMVAVLWGRHFGDIGSIVLARSCVWRELPRRCKSAFVQAECLLVADAAGARITSVDVEHLPRQEGLSSFSRPTAALHASLEMFWYWAWQGQCHALSAQQAAQIHPHLQASARTTVREIWPRLQSPNQG